MKDQLTSASLAQCCNTAFRKRLESRIVGLTLLNAFLYWPWHWLRASYDAGNHHPQLVLMVAALTVSAWWQLLAAILNRINGRLPR
jgi:hypothetical protein